MSTTASNHAQQATEATAGFGSFRLPRLAHARVKDAMRPGLITVPGDAPLREVARLLSSRHIHSAVVIRDGQLAAGPRWALLSALDLVAAAAAGAFEARSAGELAVGDPPTVSADEDLARAARMMAEHGAEHVVVVDPADGMPSGVLSTLDIAGVLAWGEA